MYARLNADNYSTKASLLVTCKFHKELLKRLLYKLHDEAPRFIHKKYGRVHTNRCEISFGIMWRNKMKGEPISYATWLVVFYRGLLEGNQTPMAFMRGTWVCG